MGLDVFVKELLGVKEFQISIVVITKVLFAQNFVSAVITRDFEAIVGAVALELRTM